MFKVLSKIVVHAAKDRGGLHRGLDYAKEERGKSSRLRPGSEEDAWEDGTHPAGLFSRGGSLK